MLVDALFVLQACTCFTGPGAGGHEFIQSVGTRELRVRLCSQHSPVV
jgi:hypothetical protein